MSKHQSVQLPREGLSVNAYLIGVELIWMMTVISSFGNLFFSFLKSISLKCIKHAQCAFLVLHRSVRNAILDAFTGANLLWLDVLSWAENFRWAGDTFTCITIVIMYHYFMIVLFPGFLDDKRFHWVASSSVQKRWAKKLHQQLPAYSHSSSFECSVSVDCSVFVDLSCTIWIQFVQSAQIGHQLDSAYRASQSMSVFIGIICNHSYRQCLAITVFEVSFSFVVLVGKVVTTNFGLSCVPINLYDRWPTLNSRIKWSIFLNPEYLLHILFELSDARGISDLSDCRMKWCA